MESLAKRVSTARMEKGWDQRRLAKEIRRINPALKTAESSISSIECGASEKPTIIVELAQALGVTESWLKTGDAPKHRSILDRRTENAVTSLLASLLGILQGMGFSVEEADALAGYVREVAEEPLNGEPPEEFDRARRILARSLARKYLISKGVKISRA